MSNQDQYFKLWQQKRSELQVDTDPQADWLAMHHLLDQQMPVANNNAGHTNQASNVVKQLSHFAKFKLLYIAAAIITSAAVTYVATRQRTAKPNKTKREKTEVRADSALHNADTATINNQAPDTVSYDKLLTDTTANGYTPANDPANTTVGDKKGLNAKRNAISPVGITDSDSKNKNGNPENLLPAPNSANGRGRNPVPSRGGADRSRLLSASDKVTNGVAQNYLKNTKNTSAVRRNNRTVTGGNAEQRNDDRRQPPDANGSILSKSGDERPAKVDRKNEAVKTNTLPLELLPSPFVINGNVPLLINNYTTSQMADKTRTAKAKSRLGQPIVDKVNKDRSSASSNIDWGILFGVNTSGGFTPKDQNKNIYGSLPIDAYTGLFATYKVSDKWASDMQLRLLVPYSFSGNYSHVFATRNDTGQVVKQTYRITDTRKVYSAQMPLHVVYHLTDNVSIKAGPVINLPIKHFGASSLTALTDTIVDSIGYAGRLADTINKVTLKRKLGVGLSGGVRFNYKRLWIEAVYYRGAQPYTIISIVGSYSPMVNNIQISLGFKLNRSKSK
jgi:hypothetical protein